MAVDNNDIIIWSAEPGKTPSPSQMGKPGRIGINEADAKLFTRTINGDVRETTLDAADRDLSNVTDKTAALTNIGAASDTFARASGAVAMPLIMKITESFSIAEYGARGDGQVYGAQFSNAVAAALADGKSILVPAGNWRSSRKWDFDNSGATDFTVNSKRPNIIGEGAGLSFVSFTDPANCGIYLRGGSVAEGLASFQRIEGLTLTGPTGGGNRGVSLRHTAWVVLDDLLVGGFDYGIWGQDVEYLQARAVRSRYNKRGVFMDGASGDANSSCPNAHNWSGCSIAHNSEYGLYYRRANALTFVGGDIQYNGIGRSVEAGWGFRTDNAGQQGGTVRIINPYIEHNAGEADVWLRADDIVIDPLGTQAAYEIQGDFKRALDPALNGRTAHFIALDFASGTGEQAVTIEGSAFKNFNANIATGPAVGFIGEKQQKDIKFSSRGNTFSSGEAVSDRIPFTPQFQEAGVSISGGQSSYVVRDGFVTWTGSGALNHPSAPTPTFYLPAPMAAGAITSGAGFNSSLGTPITCVAYSGSFMQLSPTPGDGQTISWAITYPVA